MILNISEAITACNKLKKIDLDIGDKYLEKILKSKKEEQYKSCDDKTLVESVREEIKQPLKQAVHCTTQEEWDFVKNKINRDNNWEEDYPCQILVGKTPWKGGIQFCIDEGIQILSFQEWCDLNGYKMEKEVKFEVGEWYKVVYKDTKEEYYLKYINSRHEFGYSEYILISDGIHSLFHSGNDLNIMSIPIKVSIEEIQQYLPDDHPDKIKSNQEFKIGDYIFVMIKGKNFGDILKVTDSFIEKKSNYSGVWINHKPSSFGGGGFRLNGNGYIYGKDVRHATPEEINNHLISIGQIPAGEPLNNGIEPNKDGAFKYTTLPGSSWNGLTPTNHLKAMIPTTGDCYNNDFATSYIPIKSKMILSIDDEELPMVNIIKTNSIKQLLNND